MSTVHVVELVGVLTLCPTSVSEAGVDLVSSVHEHCIGAWPVESMVD